MERYVYAHNIFAYTEVPTPDRPNYPGYVSLNVGDNAIHTLTVRSPGHNGSMCATVEVPQDQLVKMARQILDHIQGHS